MTITPITTTDQLNHICQKLRGEDYITVDTEFMRTTTFFAKLCLIQLASDEDSWIIDPLAEGLDLSAFYDLMDGGPLKVFHAARQDLEIFFHVMNKVPWPVFDTQVAAMVCGYGDSVGYETLVKSIARKQLDKSVRFTDWSQRPLSERQLAYAMSDVTHLRVIYKKLSDKLEKSGRTHWLREEFDVLTSPETYRMAPEDAWKRVKCKSSNRRFLAYVRGLAAFREELAQSRDVPRNRVMRDDTLLAIAAHPPQKPKDLKRIKGLAKRFSEGSDTSALMSALQAVRDMDENDLPQASPPSKPREKAGPALDLLKVLLKMRCAEQGVATKLVASAKEVEEFAAGSRELHFLEGWRREVFGEDALKLLNGEMAMQVVGKEIRLSKVAPADG